MDGTGWASEAAYNPTNLLDHTPPDMLNWEQYCIIGDGS